MGPIAYSLFTYALTALISYAVIGIVVLVNRTMSKKSDGKE